ncbi:putative decarboxylase [Escherichia coli]|uniref:Putative decarboxylase n=1 Tax=Escherichia coli TaxID=562 RepID=A0A377DRJ2_ECOLX|nr:putative decarboxylase [Escherichia coli]
MGLPPLSKIPLILRPQAWLHRRHYGEVLSPIRWWGRIPFIFYLVSMFVGWLERKTLTARSGSTIACQRAHCANVPV